MISKLSFQIYTNRYGVVVTPAQEPTIASSKTIPC